MFFIVSTGYRSVPLKNGYSENLELASLLVYINVQQAGVGKHTKHTYIYLQFDFSMEVFLWLWSHDSCHSESRRGAVLVLQPAEEKAGWAQQWTFPVRHAHQHSALCPPSPAEPSHERAQWEAQVSLKITGCWGKSKWFNEMTCVPNYFLSLCPRTKEKKINNSKFYSWGLSRTSPVHILPAWAVEKYKTDYKSNVPSICLLLDLWVFKLWHVRIFHFHTKND